MKKQSWDETWEGIFQKSDWGQYPSEQLIRFVARNYYSKENRTECKFLDLGCGTGASSWYLAREGFSVVGIDGSPTAIQKAKNRFKREDLKGEFYAKDYLNLDFTPETFDCVIDVASLQHNSLENVIIIIESAISLLKPNGKIFSIYLNSNTKLTEDDNSLKDKGFLHVISKEEINKVFSSLIDLTVEEISRTDGGNYLAHYIISGTKK